MVLADMRISSFDQGFRDLLTILQKKGTYFGQEITVLLAEPATYTILRKTGSVTMDQLRTECQLLAAAGPTRQEIRLISAYGSEWYAIFGADGTFVEEVVRRLNEAGVLIHQIFTLSGLILGGSSVAREKRFPALRETAIGSLRCLVGCDGQGRIYYCESGAYTDSTDWTETIKQLQIKAEYEEPDASKNDPGNSPVTPPGNVATVPYHVPKSFSHLSRQLQVFCGTIPQQSRRILTIVGSARLLLAVAVAVLTITLVSGGVFSFLAKDSWKTFDGYQEQISSTAAVEQEVRAFDRKLATEGERYNTFPQLSAGISLFCQNIPANLYLTGMKAEYVTDSGMRVIAQGLSRNEAAVFLYRNDLAEMDSSVVCEIKSLARSGSGQGADSTWYKFTLSIMR